MPAGAELSTIPSAGRAHQVESNLYEATTVALLRVAPRSNS